MRTSTIVRHTHTVTHGGETALATADNYESVCEELIRRHGPGVPKVEPIRPVNEQVTRPKTLGPSDGKLRSTLDLSEAEASGFSPARPIFERGTRVNELGVDNARTSRLEHEAKPLVTQYCREFVAKIATEQRQDEVVPAFGMRMAANGRLAVAAGESAKYRLAPSAFGSLTSLVGIGGKDYLTKCWPELRAYNVNHWMAKMASDEGDVADPKKLKLRTRNFGDTREVFAVVGPDYPCFDVDQIAQALSQAAKQAGADDARGAVAYDGRRAKFEVMFHSDVQPEEYVAGEFFKAGVLVQTDDTGGGSVRVSAVIWQNLCLNLIILDECVQEIGRIRHVGSVANMARKFRATFDTALNSISHFRRIWGYATHEDVVTPVAEAEGIPASQVLPGLFNGIIERELVPVRGKRKEVIPALMQMYAEDTSFARVHNPGVTTRAAVVNAFTRYAHQINRDPFHATEIERGAGGLLNITRDTKKLPYLPL